MLTDLNRWFDSIRFDSRRYAFVHVTQHKHPLFVILNSYRHGETNELNDISRLCPHFLWWWWWDVSDVIFGSARKLHSHCSNAYKHNRYTFHIIPFGECMDRHKIAHCVGISLYSMPRHAISFHFIFPNGAKRASIKKVVAPLLSRWWCDQRKNHQMYFSVWPVLLVRNDLCFEAANTTENIIKPYAYRILFGSFIYFVFFFFLLDDLVSLTFSGSFTFWFVCVLKFLALFCLCFRFANNESNRCVQQARDYSGLSCSNSNVVVTITLISWFFSLMILMYTFFLFINFIYMAYSTSSRLIFLSLFLLFFPHFFIIFLFSKWKLIIGENDRLDFMTY